MTKRIGILLSGGGSNFQALADSGLALHPLILLITPILAELCGAGFGGLNPDP